VTNNETGTSSWSDQSTMAPGIKMRFGQWDYKWTALFLSVSSFDHFQR